MIKRCAGPVFEEVWHAQLFAVTVHLNEGGHFKWQDWVANFGEMLQARGLNHSQNGGHDYFVAWLDALENFLSQKGIAQLNDLRDLRIAWQYAYLSTPHGDPIIVE